MDQFAIIYAAESKAVRRIVVSDDPDYDYSRHVGAGEDHIIADTKDGTDVFAARAAVEAETGEKSPEPLVAVVDNSGGVVALMMADPVLDAIEGHDLVQAYDGVFEGCTYDVKSGTYSTPIKITPAGIDKDGNPYPETIVGGEPVPKPADDVDAALAVRGG